MKKMKILSLLLSSVMMVSMIAGCGNGSDNTGKATDAATDAPKAEAYEMDATASVALKATGMCTYNFEEEQEEAWADAVSEVYIREMPEDPSGTALTDADKIDFAKATISTTKVILDSDLFSVDPSSSKDYEVTLKAEGYDDYHLALTVQNQRPNDFTVRTIDGDGKVVTEKTFTFEEMEAMCTHEDYYSASCPMHSLNSYHAIGVYLDELLDKAGVEFTKGMSLAMRSVDAPATIEATEINNSNVIGTFENPESYWMKARYTDNYKLTYENLCERERYFVSAPFESEEMAAVLAEDGSNWSIDCRAKLAESGLYKQVKQPMIAIQYESFQYSDDTSDPRTTTSTTWNLSKNERAFCFLFGLAMDDDPTKNYTAFDDAKGEYPLVTDESYAGVTAFEEGPDPCGTSARQGKLLFGIDIFLEGGVN